jgi:hypothetical protein
VRKILAVQLIIYLLVFSALLIPFQIAKVSAADDYKPMTAAQIEAEMDLFLGEKQASGYLVWQYSGDRMDPLGNDQYSFFYNLDSEPQICQALKKMSQKYTDKFIGVNMFDVGKKGTAYAAKHFKHLHDDCGVTVIRTFPSESGGVSAVEAVREAADQTGIKIIYAIANPYYGTGGIPTFEAMATDHWQFYKSGYNGEYKTYALSILQAAKAKPNTLFGLELANEPHCLDGAGDSGALTAYKNWANVMAGVLSSAGNVGIGQMASDANSACDSPSLGNSGSTPFAQSNSSPNINMASAHYYTDTAKEQALKAADEAKSIGKMFYIGEAGWGGEASNNKKSSYYLYPIKGLLSGDVNTFRQDLINQGYQAVCTTPKINILGNIGGLDKLSQATLNSLTGQKISVESEQKFDYSKANIPILRDGNDQSPSLFSSIEDYWGFKNTTEKNPISQQIASSPIYSLLTLEDQCIRQKKMLDVIEKMCLKLSDPSTCALNKKIPGTDYSSLTLNTLVKGHPSLTCKRIANGESLNDEETKIATAIRNTPLYLDKAYRLGFLVVAAELKPPTTGISFNFLKWGTKENDYVPKHDVRVVAFKLPDTTTNKDKNSDIYYEEPLLTSRNALLSDEKLNQIETDAAAKKQLTRLNTQADLIECGNDDLCQPNTLSRELVNFVNDRVEHLETCDANPQDLPFEDVKTIKDQAELPTGEQTNQTIPPEKGNVVEQLSKQQINQQYQAKSGSDKKDLGAFRFLSFKKLGDKEQTSFNTKISSYLIIPQGYELATAEKTLAGLIYTDEELKKMENTAVDSPEFEYKQYFKLTDTGQEFGESKSTQDTGIFDQECIAKLSQRLNRQPNMDESKQCLIKIETSVRSITDKGETDSKEQDREPRIFGARLGFLMRKIQQSLFAHDSSNYDYVKTCKTTEEYLQGNCKGDAQSASGVQQPINRLGKCYEDCMAKPNPDENACRTSCQETAGSCIEVWVSQDQANTFADAIAENLPLQKTATLHFAGWEAYFRGVDGIPYLFEPACDGSNKCYQYIIDRVLASPRSDGLVVNPYLAIAIALNETGGLKSTDASAGHRGAHFGCGISSDGSGISQDTIENKLSCLMGYFQNNQSLNSNDSLKRYGYVNGNQNGHLTFIIDVVSNYSYQGSCNNN